MEQNKIYNLIKIIFIFFISILLIEGAFHFYYYLISQKFDFLEFKNQSGYNTLIWSENGLVEFLQVILLFLTLLFLLIFFKKKAGNLNKLIKVFMVFYFLGVLYYFFEEISWGQHIFGWQTAEFFSKINTQNETNFHNTSNLFNELPRSILLIWCSLSFIFIKIIDGKYYNLKNIIYPNQNLKFISIIILIFVIPDLFIDKLNLAPGHPANNEKEILLNIIFEILSFNFVRLSELQELLFNFYILWHSYYLVKVRVA